MIAARTADDYLAIVAQAWTATLPGVPFAPDLSWADGGADSLKSLQMIMRLEEMLETRIPLDLLRPETTPVTLSALLQANDVG